MTTLAALLLLADSAVAAQARLNVLLAQPAPDGVELRWSFAGDAGASPVIVERDGRRLAETERTSYLDREAPPGRHEYRVRPAGGAGRRVSFLVPAACGARPELRLAVVPVQAPRLSADILRLSVRGSVIQPPGCELVDAGFSVAGPHGVEGPLELDGGAFSATISVPAPAGGEAMSISAWAENAAGRGSAVVSVRAPAPAPSAEPFSEEHGAWNVWPLRGWPR